MNFRNYLIEEIDPEVKKLKVGDQISFYIGKDKYASNTLFTGKVKKIKNDVIYVTTTHMYDYESLPVRKSEMVLEK